MVKEPICRKGKAKNVCQGSCFYLFLSNLIKFWKPFPHLIVYFDYLLFDVFLSSCHAFLPANPLYFDLFFLFISLLLFLAPGPYVACSLSCPSLRLARQSAESRASKSPKVKWTTLFQHAPVLPHHLTPKIACHIFSPTRVHIYTLNLVLVWPARENDGGCEWHRGQGSVRLEVHGCLCFPSRWNQTWPPASFPREPSDENFFF